MGWNDEQESIKKGMSLSSKILLLIIICMFIIIAILIWLLLNMQGTSANSVYVDGANANISKETLLTKIDNVTYINIQEFAKLVGYEYHQGEYKAVVIDEDKCYVEGAEETASFYLNENKVYKLPVNKQSEDYKEYSVENEIKLQNEIMYAPINAISKAFNVVISETDNTIEFYTLDYLVNLYDAKVIEWGYTSILEQSLENKKSLIYGCLIVKKEGGLYKVIDLKNTKEILPARYMNIEFSGYTQEFIATISAKEVGIINLDGTTKIEPVYEAVTLLDKEKDLYIIVSNGKLGVVRGNNTIVIFPEYEAIGLNNSSITNESKNRKMLLDQLIPVYSGGKWGAYDVNGKMILSLEYDDFGYNLTSIEINGIKESVESLLSIKRCNGVVVKKANKYGLISTSGDSLVPIAVEAIYAITDTESNETKYYMLYNGEEMNVIERLIAAGLLEEEVTEEDNNDDNTITDNNNIVDNTETENTITNTTDDNNTETNSVE